MLVIQRKAEESIIIGENIQVSVLAVKGKRVILGIDAPKDIPITREESHREQEVHGEQGTAT